MWRSVSSVMYWADWSVTRCLSTLVAFPPVMCCQCLVRIVHAGMEDVACSTLLATASSDRLGTSHVRARKARVPRLHIMRSPLVVCVCRSQSAERCEAHPSAGRGRGRLLGRGFDPVHLLHAPKGGVFALVFARRQAFGDSVARQDCPSLRRHQRSVDPWSTHRCTPPLLSSKHVHTCTKSPTRQHLSGPRSRRDRYPPRR